MKMLFPGRKFTAVMLLAFFCPFISLFAQINRQALVQRHKVLVNKIDPLSSLSVGNGKFAFTVDATGLQTFPDAYAKGVPLGTQSEWGWDTFKDTANYKIEEAYKYYNQYGRKVPYTVQLNEPKRAKEAVNFYRQNVHRLQLGNIGLELRKANGKSALPEDIKNISQQLDPWTGEIKSSFTFEGITVNVTTVGHQDQDIVAATVKSDLIKLGRLKIKLRFPYPTGDWADAGNNWATPERHHSAIVNSNQNGAIVRHQLDSASYFTSFSWKTGGRIIEKSKHYFTIVPDKKSNEFNFSCLFSDKKNMPAVPLFAIVQANSISKWKAFWLSGAAVDFSGSIDKRASELERRIILSLYLTKIQCAGDFPPQETGLTYNSWYGKPHLEMHWWHGVHFALWGRPELLNKSVDWYFKVKDKAAVIAKRQGFDGVRWQKMTDNEGNESPSSVGAMLIWQQPHIITFTELEYRAHPDQKILQKYKDLVFSTADFMTSFAHYDVTKQHYVLGPGLIPAQERFKAETTFNPTYELAYWEWALKTAQQWRVRLGMSRNAKWDDVIAKLSPLPKQDGVYLATESAIDSYTNPEYKTDHPSVLGTYGMLPETSLLDKEVMRKTFNLVWDTWSWSNTWGWDFPMTAMTAARLNMPEKAIDALMMDVQTNTYLINGHNYQDERLRLYLPGNGGLLTAIAMMCAGWDGNTIQSPGFPKDGTWKVKWEGFKKMM
ncbi:MAG: hypothetical protein P0Y49_03210 [Candidatus Pedobacter colombiensis]|uniref:Glycoside hydrolase family 65 n=1 Tax=Candidatus Pedobacter colombiensis TaxID=3121371 RepID=A0AAJ5WCG1_9SPHI|nr:hypothetical protein [Pedobacter sp.]WEK20157.1 MAG: hypothetical protein P0Y49_03210 [Pedobacter sp.]